MTFSSNNCNESRKFYVETPLTEIKPVLIEKRESFSQEDTLSVALCNFSVSHECASRMKLRHFVTECSSTLKKFRLSPY